MNSKFLDFIFGYESSEKNFSESRVAKAEKKFSEKVIGGIGSAYSKRILDSKISKFFAKLSREVCETSIKNYGIFFLAFGLITLLANFADYYFSDFDTNATIPLVVGAVFSIAGIPLLFLDYSLIEILQKFLVTNVLFFDIFCLKRRKISEQPEVKNSQSYIAAILGIAVASVAFITSLPIIIASITALAFLALAFASPEFALMISLLVIPLIPILPNSSLILVFLIGITLISYLSKVVLGKRLLRFEQYDAVLIAFMLFVLISGIFNKGIVSFEKSVIMILLACSYFLVSNIIVNRRLAENAVKIIIFSSVPTAIYGIITYFISPEHPEWIDPMFRGDIVARAYSTFANPNIYAVYLVVTTIFSFAFSIDKSNRKFCLYYIAAFILNITALALTWSRGAWLAVILSALAFAIIRSRRTPKILLIPALAIPVAILFIPEDFISRMLSAFNLGDSSVSSRLSIWRSSLRMFYENIFIGAGIGEDAFSEEFLKYAEDSVTAPHSHNLFLEIGCEIGIFALICFAFLLLIRIRHRATYAKYVRNSSVDNLCTISGTSLFALLLFGMTDYIWYSSSMYLFFWIIFGMGSATLRISKKEYDDSIVSYSPEREENSADINIIISSGKER